jgi:hypothetical protein
MTILRQGSAICHTYTTIISPNSKRVFMDIIEICSRPKEIIYKYRKNNKVKVLFQFFIIIIFITVIMKLLH